MKEIRNYYFKSTHEEGRMYISGCPLPDSKKGPYHFISCTFHPGLWSIVRQEYKDSKFTDTYTGPPAI